MEIGKNWIDKLEEYFDAIAPELQPEVRAFLDEYYEKKDTHSATSLVGLSEEELKSIFYLELRRNQKDFKESLSKIKLCENLKILDSQYGLNNFKYLTGLTNLRVLGIFSDEILEGEHHMSGLNELFVFSLWNMAELDLFEQIKGMSKLIICSLDGATNLREFPHNLSNLIELHLVYQDIQDLPPLNSFSRLKILHFSDTSIKTLPTSIVKLINLKKLWIAGNKLEALPEEVFSLQHLEEVFFSDNPYNLAPHIQPISEYVSSTGFENEIEFFYLLKELNSQIINSDYNYITLKIPKLLKTPMLQYIEFFKDYVEATKGKEIIFDVKRDKEGLVLVTNGNIGVTLPELGDYFKEYVELVQTDLDKWIPNFDIPTTSIQADIFRSKLERQVYSLRSDLDIARLESRYLSEQVADRDAQIDFLKSLTQNFQHDIRLLVEGKTAENLNVEQLLLDIQDQAVKMLERKHSQQLEDLHNDVLTDFLRQKGYFATDQTRSGRSKLGVGELDIMIRKKDGTPFSIIEAFRLKSCGEKNKIVAEHLDKLLHDYDTAGHECNFVIVYAEAKNFEGLWKNYQKYVSEINGKQSFRATYPLIKFEDKPEVSDKSSIKIGFATHRREGSVVGVYHIFINMFA